MQVLDHPVLSLDVLLDLAEVFRGLAEIWLLLPVHHLLALLCVGEDVLDGVGDDEVFVGLEALDGLVGGLGNWFLLVGAVVGEVAD